MEQEASRRQLVEPAHMLDDRDAGCQQDRVCRTLRILHVVDIRTVDADQRHTRLDQRVACSRRQERAGVELVRRAPVVGPIGAHQHGLAFEIAPTKAICFNRTLP